MTSLSETFYLFCISVMGKSYSETRKDFFFYTKTKTRQRHTKHSLNQKSFLASLYVLFQEQTKTTDIRNREERQRQKGTWQKEKSRFRVTSLPNIRNSPSASCLMSSQTQQTD